MRTNLTDPAYADQLDRADELAGFRALFHVDPGVVYLNGNSLGLWSRPADEAVCHVLEQWRRHGVAGWTEADPPWFTLAEELGAVTAPLLGAAPDQVVVTNSTTVNLHQLLVTLYRPDTVRPQILIDALAFPSDLYAVRSHMALRGLDPADHLVVVPSEDGVTLDEGRIIASMTEGVQVAVLPAALYTSGQLLDIAALAAAAQDRGVLLGIDCSHAVGAVPHALDEWGVDFAFWCGYKYLNGGPGAAAGLYLNRRHFGRTPGLAGWFGSRKDRQFDLAPKFVPAEGAGALQIGTPNILSMAPLLGTLRTIAEAGIERIRRKSLDLTRYLMELADTVLAPYGFELATPREDRRRGGHVALAHPEALRICAALRAAGVIPDYRPPRIVRLAPVAVYTSFADCRDAVARLADIMETRNYEQQAAGRGLVT